MWRRDRVHTHRFLVDPVKEMVAKGIETATTGAGWLKGGPQMVSDVVCGVVDTWVSVIDPNEGTIRKAMSGDAATLDELASLASTIGSIVFVVYVCMTAVNLFLATAESVAAHKSNFAARPTPSTRRQLRCGLSLVDLRTGRFATTSRTTSRFPSSRRPFRSSASI